jgi:hypothetical protein
VQRNKIVSGVYEENGLQKTWTDTLDISTRRLNF